MYVAIVNLTYYFLSFEVRGCDRMVVGFTTTCVINAYHH